MLACYSSVQSHCSAFNTNCDTILICVKAAARRFNQLDNSVPPTKALYWPLTVPREICSLSQVCYSLTGKRVSPPPSPSACWQISPINSAYTFGQFFSHNLSITRHTGVLSECQLWTQHRSDWLSYYYEGFIRMSIVILTCFCFH